MRMTVDGKKHQKVLLDPLDKDVMENKIDAIIHCYHKLTTRKIALGFSKPSTFQQKIIDSRKAKQWMKNNENVYVLGLLLRGRPQS